MAWFPAVALRPWIGWLTVIGSLRLGGAMLGGVMLWPTNRGAAIAMIGSALPGCFLGLAAGILIIRGRRWGYYLAAAAAVVGLFLGSISLLAVPPAWLEFGPGLGHGVHVLNLVALGILALSFGPSPTVPRDSAEDAPEASGSPASKGWFPRRLGLVWVLVLAGFVAWSANQRVLEGEAPLVEVPLAGPALAGLYTDQPVAFVGVARRFPDSGHLILSGTTTEASAHRLAMDLGLASVTAAQATNRFLPLARSWKLSSERYPQEFSGADRLWLGRVKGPGLSVLQLGWRRLDGRFTAQFILLRAPDEPKR